MAGHNPALVKEGVKKKKVKPKDGEMQNIDVLCSSWCVCVHDVTYFVLFQMERRNLASRARRIWQVRAQVCRWLVVTSVTSVASSFSTKTKTSAPPSSVSDLLVSSQLRIFDVTFSSRDLVAASEVSWVQCDRCELWFHMKCIGVNEQDFTDDDEYICTRCRTPHATPSASASNLQHNPTTGQSHFFLALFISVA